MEIIYFESAEKQLNYFKKTNQIKILKKIRELLENILETPYEGIGKPEALKYEFTGLWSRRINKEHRIVYEIKNNFLIIHSLKGHY
ncbi:MAG: Txe/YoeB family addiction module toxin [Flavobacteriales bacterium]|nr:Txe/YoeB family addiction module toxin [Flavobacteriales bacterium]